MALTGDWPAMAWRVGVESLAMVEVNQKCNGKSSSQNLNKHKIQRHLVDLFQR